MCTSRDPEENQLGHIACWNDSIHFAVADYGTSSVRDSVLPADELTTYHSGDCQIAAGHVGDNFLVLPADNSLAILIAGKNAESEGLRLPIC